MYYRVLIASQRYHGDESLTYASDEKLNIGQIVKAPLGNIAVTGIVVEAVSKPSFAAKALLHSWDVVVPDTTIRLIWWLSAYYPAALGSITELFTPPAMPKTLKPTVRASSPIATEHLPSLTQEQSQAMRDIKKSQGKSVLLHGDTGTGKTRLYLELAQEAVQRGKSVIVTTPEIGLTEPLVTLFSKVFGTRVFVTHSSMTAAARRQQWIAVCNSTDPVILIGPRSALFYPVRALGLVILDEAHDTAYKQDQTPYYQASRVAAELARLHKAQLVLGTATPLTTDYYYFLAKNLPVVRLTAPAIHTLTTVSSIVVDSRKRANFSRSPYLSDQLLAAMTEALANNEQTILFLNRRGSARVVLCNACGWQALCPRCDTSLTFHADTHNMRCHSCDYKDTVPATCPQCRGSELFFTSIGTKALETEIAKHFPGAIVARFDGDTHRSESLVAKFNDLQQGTIDIVIGTQSITKGHDLPKLSVIGVVQADTSLAIPDYTAAERTYQLLTQVIGRIGRGHRSGTLVLQTHNPDNPIISQALAKDYQTFYNQEIAERQTYNFPPFVYLMTVVCTRATAASAEKACLRAKQQLLEHVPGISIEGPTPRFVEKIANRYSWHLIVRSRSRTRLTEAIKHLPAGCNPNLDPTDLL